MRDQSNYLLDKITKKEVAGARGFGLCAYLIALEGWRRGLNLKFYNNPSSVTEMKVLGVNTIGKTFSLSYNEKIHFFNRSRGDLVSNEAIEICRNKEKTKEVLANANVPVPEGKRFTTATSDEEMLEYAKSIGFPVVLKPTTGSLGKGVFANISNAKELQKAIGALRKEIKFDEYIIEEFKQGNEYRVYVVNDKVISAVHRVPANIRGDGKSTIASLIEQKNKEKKANPYLAGKKIKIDSEIEMLLDKKGYDLQTVPNEGEVIYLREKSNVSTGGDPVDATDSLSHEVKKIAVETVNAISDLHHAGIDIIIDPAEPNKCTVIEVNATAEMSMHVFPLSGQVRDVPRAIIDFYFPETLEHSSSIKRSFYFDYKIINDMLKTRSVNVIEVRDMPMGQLYAKQYIVSGKVQGVGYRNSVRKKAIDLNISGYVKNLANGNVVIVAATTNINDFEDFKSHCLNGSMRAQVTNILENDWEEPIKIGFEIKNPTQSEEITDLKSLINNEKRSMERILKEKELMTAQYNELKRDYKKKEEQFRKVKKQLNNVQNSRSWKITSPLRKVMNLLGTKGN